MSNERHKPHHQSFDSFHQRNIDINKARGIECVGLHKDIIQLVLSSPLSPNGTQNGYTLDRIHKIAGLGTIMIDFVPPPELAEGAMPLRALRLSFPAKQAYQTDTAYSIEIIMANTDETLIDEVNPRYAFETTEMQQSNEQIITAVELFAQLGVDSLSSLTREQLANPQFQDLLEAIPDNFRTLLNIQTLEQLPYTINTTTSEWDRLKEQAKQNRIRAEQQRQDRATALHTLMEQTKGDQTQLSELLFQLIDQDMAPFDLESTAGIRNRVSIPQIEVDPFGNHVWMEFTYEVQGERKNCMIHGYGHNDVQWQVHFEHNGKWIGVDNMLGSEIGYRDNQLFVKDPIKVDQDVRQHDSTAKDTLQQLILGIAQNGISLDNTVLSVLPGMITNHSNMMKLVRRIFPNRCENDLKNATDNLKRLAEMHENNEKWQNNYHNSIADMAGVGILELLDPKFIPLIDVQVSPSSLVFETRKQKNRRRAKHLKSDQFPLQDIQFGIHRGADGDTIVLRPGSKIVDVKPYLFENNPEMITAVIEELDSMVEHSGIPVSMIDQSRSTDTIRNESVVVKPIIEVVVSNKVEVIEENGAQYSVYIFDYGKERQGIIVCSSEQQPTCYIKKGYMPTQEEIRNIDALAFNKI